MTAYLFWHRPYEDVAQEAYEQALIAFHRDFAGRACDGFQGSATYRITETPWLGKKPGYEDWTFVESSAALDPLNKAAVAPAMWDVHAAIAGKTQLGHGGLYQQVLLGETDPATLIRTALTRTAWLERPRGIRYEVPLEAIAYQARELTGGPVSVWRKQLVLGPAPEFALLGNASLTLDLPEGWRASYVDRVPLYPAT